MVRILHIEDDPANRLLVRKLLTSKGFTVTDAEDGLEGIRLAREIEPDLILVDINIPHLDGYEVTLRLRGESALAQTPIVAITAEGDKATSLTVGCDGYVQKPINARTFAATVAGYLKGDRDLQEEDSGETLRKQSQKIVARLEAKVAELSDANTRLLELDRARTAFYRNISHELATPMTPIVGYLKLLGDGELGPVTAAQARSLSAMEDCVVRLRGIIDNLIDVTGLETGKMRFLPKSYDLGQLLRSCIAQAETAAGRRGQTIVHEIPQGAMPAFGDSQRLARAVGQLLENAIKFTPTGGYIGLAARSVADRYELLVADSGEGIAGDQRDKVFEPFYQVDASPTRKFGGVGVGLAIVKRVVEGLEGQVRVLPTQQVRIADQNLGGAALLINIAAKVGGLAGGRKPPNE